MPPYNTDILDNSTSIHEAATAINNASNGLFGTLALLVFGIALLIVFRSRENMKSLMIGVSFIVSLLAVVMWITGYVTISIFWVPFIFLIGTVFIVIWGG